MTAGGYIVREPMRLLEAEAWVIAKLGATPRAFHSRFVGGLMRSLAGQLAPSDAELWEITGLLHDLDFFVVDGDWHIHGRTAAAWLEGRLPLSAMLAIAAHDHRSGILSDALLSRALRLCDALAVLDQNAGREATRGALPAGEAAIYLIAADRPFLASMIVELSDGLGVTLVELAQLLRTMPGQPANGETE